MPRILKTTGVYANLVSAIGVEDDGVTVKDFKVPSRVVTLETGVTVVDGAYGRGVRVTQSGGAYAPRGINLSPGIAQSNNTGARTTIFIFNDYTSTNDGRQWVTMEQGNAPSGFWMRGGGGVGENPRLYSDSALVHTSLKSILSGRSFVAMGVDFGSTKAQKIWVAVDGEAFPAAPEYEGASTATNAVSNAMVRLGGSGIGSQDADWFMCLEFSALLTHAEIATIYNSLQGSGAIDIFEPVAVPTISVQPTNQSVEAPNPGTFNVTAPGATSYQWKKNGVNVGAPTASSSLVTGATAVSTGDWKNGDVISVIPGNSGGPGTESSGASLSVTAPVDSTRPVQTGGIVITNLTANSYTLSYPAGTDNVGVNRYEYSLNAGSTWTSNNLSLTANITGRTPGTTDNIQVRTVDAAGNVSTPVLSTDVTLGTTSVSLGPFGSSGTFWPNGTPVLVNWFPGWRPGDAIPGTATVRSAAVVGTGGMVPLTGLPVGAGGGLVTRRFADVNTDKVSLDFKTVV